MSGGATGHPICMRIVISGATGNIGSNVVQRLRARRTRNLAGLARQLPEGPASHAGTGAPQLVAPERLLDRQVVSHTDTPVTAAVIAGPLGAKLVHVSSAAVCAVKSAARHACQQQFATGLLVRASRFRRWTRATRSCSPGWSGA